MKNKMLFVLKLAMALLALALVAFGAQGPNENALNSDNPRVREMIEAQEEVTPDLMAMEDVIGTAVGQDDDGELTILVFVNLEGKHPADSARNIPKEFRGKHVTVQVTEPFRAMVGKPGGGGGGGGVSHKAKQTPPIQMGTSGGWRYDLANGYCCGGTLGSLVQIGSTQYILSNYHVFQSDIVDGGNGIIAQGGDPIIQPGLIDVGCNQNNAQNVAGLILSEKIVPSLPLSNVDASIAQVNTDPTIMVSTNGAILEIGTLSSEILPAAVNQAVKKSGRTTGLSRSTITGINATISVQYENECAGGVAFTKTFNKQIVIANRGSKFLNSGDSGSLMVEDVTANPRAIGLLFAGSSTSAIANPIKEVLDFFGASMVGVPPAP